jgi:peptide-methionine (S)-S-oxide reductase
MRAGQLGRIGSRSGFVLLSAALGFLLVVGLLDLRAADAPTMLPAATLDDVKAPGPLRTAVLAGGCFWGVQGVFEHVKGVRRVLAGYAGGKGSTADYETVSSGTTGHAESVEITYDPQQISYGEILRVFFSVAHDPTELNRQGPDVGTQYRSVIFYADPMQERIARAYISQLEQAHAFGRPIVTRVDPLTGFYKAEEYHQDYLVRHPDNEYIVYVDMPKIARLKQTFAGLYRDQPALVAAAF